MKIQGFTLIELLCTLTIIAILSCFAYPSYVSAMVKLKRLEAKSALIELQNNYERYFILHHSYEDATIGKKKNSIFHSDTTLDGNYQLEITKKESSYYLLTAKPLSVAAQQDKACGSFTLNSLGEQGITGTGDAYKCWHP